jgi:hypothetical protein
VAIAEEMGMARFQDNRQDEGSAVPTWSSTLLQYMLWVEFDNEGVGQLKKVNDAWTQPLVGHYSVFNGNLTLGDPIYGKSCGAPVGRIVAPNCRPEPARDFPIRQSCGPHLSVPRLGCVLELLMVLINLIISFV